MKFMKDRCRDAVNWRVLLPRDQFSSPKRTNKRDLTAGVDSAGGYLVDDSTRSI